MKGRAGTGSTSCSLMFGRQLTSALVFAKVGALYALDVHYLVEVVRRDAVLPT